MFSWKYASTIICVLMRRMMLLQITSAHYCDLWNTKNKQRIWIYYDQFIQEYQRSDTLGMKNLFFIVFHSFLRCKSCISNPIIIAFHAKILYNKSERTIMQTKWMINVTGRNFYVLSTLKLKRSMMIMINKWYNGQLKEELTESFIDDLRKNATPMCNVEIWLHIIISRSSPVIYCKKL